ncbi:hypothetical protein KTE26_21930, partial [Ralstonia mannitolilytica]|nr:hypothetical protein [Ralstonia mannitolilytica]
SFSHSSGSASGSYAGVNEQSGIQAGSGGFDINVKGNTDLKGAVIASTATPDKNQLTTGTLTFSDIQNHSDYNASSSGFSLSGSLGNGGNNYKKAEDSKSRNVAGGAPMLSQNESGSESATTRSAISQGTITITDKANQKQDVASLSRDTAGTNGTVSKTPDLQNILNNQADMMSAAQAAGQAVAQRIGDYADGKKAAADAAAKQAAKDGNSELAAQYQQEADSWKEGGLNRAAMQAAGSALVSGLGGGNALAGAAGGGAASLAAGRLNDLAGSIASSSPTGNKNVDEALGNIVSNALATAVGGAVGGNAGAFSGYNVDRFNRQLHPEDAKSLAALKKGQSKAEQDRLDAAACYLVHCADGVPPSDPNYARLQSMQSQGAQYTMEVQALKSTGQFTYSVGDAITDGYTSHPAFKGVANVVGGGLGTAGGVALTAGAIAACPATAVSCAGIPVGAGVTGLSLNQFNTGVGQIAGTAPTTEGQTVLNSFNPNTPGRSNPLVTDAITTGVGVATGVVGGRVLGALAADGTAVSSQAANASANAANEARINANFHRDDNLTTGLVPAATVNQQFTNQGYSAPFTAGTFVNVGVAGTAAPANMVVTSGQAAAIADGKPALGAFSTPDLVPNQAYVRSNLAVTPSMKPDVSMLQPVQTTGKPMVTVEGGIAPQVPVSQYPGGGNQTFYDFPVGGVRSDYVKPVGPAIPIPPGNGTH